MKAQYLAVLALLFPWHCPDSIGLRAPDTTVGSSISAAVSPIAAVADSQQNANVSLATAAGKISE